MRVGGLSIIKKKYVVDVYRTAYSSRKMEVLAETPKEAGEIAMDTAGGYEFRTITADYKVDSVHEVTTLPEE